MPQLIEKWEQILTDIRKELATFDPSKWEKNKDIPDGRLLFKSTLCNKPGCSCATDASKAHGPYPYLQKVDENKRPKQHYVNRAEAKKILPIIAERERYERLRSDEAFYAELIGLMRKCGLQNEK